MTALLMLLKAQQKKFQQNIINISEVNSDWRRANYYLLITKY
jgi:hypothetical protein